MLKITGDGRKAALDTRLVTGRPASTPGKLQAAAENIARLYHATRDREYLDALTGQPSPTPGALQIVFCDLSTPGRERAKRRNDGETDGTPVSGGAGPVRRAIASRSSYGGPTGEVSHRSSGCHGAASMPLDRPRARGGRRSGSGRRAHSTPTVWL